ncbi:hypothetical protein ACVWY1_002450 [Pseudomonas sp. TE6288]|uniref:hypothetical protein n=1 Tax=Pseudomonas hunanensis TaxID=1247546 RepID=UPI002404DBD9|nr:hypothetical protein [Pseudomonas hunanensis]MDF9756320.1 hypothetical protein [Pseudomonas hunanensis]
MLPEKIRISIRDKIWSLADQIGWSSLNDLDRSKLYERWTKDPDVGGQLAHFMDPRKVRVYIKDSLIKPYERAKLLAAEDDIWRALDMSPPRDVSGTFIKPHGCQLDDGRVVCWGKSRDWKLVLMAAFERAINNGGVSHGVVLLETGKTSDESSRKLVVEASLRLGIKKIAWLD